MKNKRGFTLVELLVSFVLITAVSFALFRTVLSLQQKQQVNLAKNKYKAFTTVLNNTLQKDFLTDKVLSITDCGTNCYEIIYEKNGNIQLTLDRENNTVTYGSTKQELPGDYKFYDDMNVRTYNNPNTNGLDSFVIISLPIKSSLSPELEEIKYMYQYDNAQNDTYVDPSIEYSTLLVNLDGGEDNFDYRVKYNNGSILNLVEPTKTGYLFNGWEVVSGANASVNGNTLKMGTEDTTVKAKWLTLTNGVTHITNLQTTAAIANGLIKDDTDDENIRYAGSNDDVKNYVYYNCLDIDAKGTSYGKYGYDYENSCELWRIIGVFDVSNGTTTANRIKLVRDESIGDMSWDSSSDGTIEGETAVNGGSGINQWGEVKNETGNITYEGADLMRLLNGYYLGKTGATCTYCNGANQSGCSNDCSSSVTPLSTTARNMIDEVVWNLGAVKHNELLSLFSMYTAERGTQVGNSLCTLGTTNCNDNVERTTTWKGIVGLIYPSDYGYASTNETCANDINGSDSTCKTNNWLHPSTYTYNTISPWTYTSQAYGIWAVYVNYGVDDCGAANANDVHPSVYLNSNVKIVEGTDGTSGNPYILYLNDN